MSTKLQYTPPAHYTDDECAIWQVLIYNDFVAFCSQDWKLISDDFIEEGFFGIDGHGSNNKLEWSLMYPNLESYKSAWINQSVDFSKKNFLLNPLEVLFDTTELNKFELVDDCALVHKSFSGKFELEDSTSIVLDWLSIFFLRKVDGNWKIASFTGYLPK